MWRVSKAEVRYGFATLLSWFAVLLVLAMWPFVESWSASTIPTVLAFMAIALPIVTAISGFQFLSVEQREARLRLFGTLPVGPVTIALARHTRTLTLPFLTLVLALVLIAVGVVASGAAFLSTLSGAWVLLSLLLASVAASAFVTLLYDAAGMAFAQISVALAVAVAFVLNAYSPTFGSAFAEPLAALAQTPLGILVMALLCCVLVTGDVGIFVWRRRS